MPALFDTLYRNGVIFTQDADRPRCHSLGVAFGRIVSLDDELPASAFRNVVDLRGAAVVPGFNDAHLHLSHIGWSSRAVDLRPSVAPSLDGLLEAVGRAAAAAAPGEWVIGEGYDQNYLGGDHPTAEQLDRVSQGHPVWLVHVSRHMGVANTEAFARAGYPDRRGVPSPAGGAVPVDGSGLAVGLVQETAKVVITAAIPAVTVEDVAEMVAVGSQELLKLGITSITEPGLGAPDHIGWSLVDLAGYQACRDAGRLRVRATVMPYLTALHAIGDGDFGLDLGLRTGLGDEWLRIGATKVLSDGSLIGRSACMCTDYANDHGNTGYLQFPAESLHDWIIGAHRAGWQVAMHAIGDSALDTVMDVVEEAQRVYPRRQPRHRIEHFSVASVAQIARAARLGLVAVPQPRFVYELGDAAAAALGRERTPCAYRLRSLLDGGVPVALSTDAPVVSPDPILNISAAVNRRTSSGEDFVPEERITVAEAITAYTLGSAYATGEERVKGRLVHGMLADFAVLSEDIYSVSPERITDVTVTATVVGGDLAFGDLT